MRLSSKLPAELWPEITLLQCIYTIARPDTHTTGQLHMIVFELMSLETNEIVCTNRKQQLGYLKVYGCKTYALTTEYLKNTQRKKLRLHPKAWIGYLNLVIFNKDEWKS